MPLPRPIVPPHHHAVGCVPQLQAQHLKEGKRRGKKGKVMLRLLLSGEGPEQYLSLGFRCRACSWVRPAAAGPEPETETEEGKRARVGGTPLCAAGRRTIGVSQVGSRVTGALLVLLAGTQEQVRVKGGGKLGPLLCAAGRHTRGASSAGRGRSPSPVPSTME